ncbi:MAG: DegT/DnrJ/EryC1/StrS family aminotransferase [Rhodomicrobium sp.]
MSAKIHYTKPSITELEVAYATDAARNGWGPRCYDYIKRFETGFKAFAGSEFAIATSSCTGAMHMGLHALGIGPGDEVILADINWIATAAPIVHVGATPVLVDILPDSWCISPDAAEAAITARTKAIVATHLYGNLCDLDRLSAIAEAHGIALIEDAAEGIGSRWHGRQAGSIGRFGTFSFHGTKTMTTGEGGMFVTNDAGLYETVLTLSNHGRSRHETKQFWANMVGFKYKMSNIQAALGCAQLERIEELIARKREIFMAYREGFAGMPVAMNPEPEGCRNGYWMPTLVFEPQARHLKDAVMEALRAHNIDARVFFHPLSDQGHFEMRHATPISHDISSRAFNLPSYHDLTREDIRRVVEIVEQVLGANGLQTSSRVA